MNEIETHDENSSIDQQTAYLLDTRDEKTGVFPTLQQLAVALGILGLLFGAALLPDSEKNLAAPASSSETEIQEEIPVPIDIVNHFKEITIAADAGYVWDVQNQRALYNKNAGAQLPLASLTKLMTALVAYEIFSESDNINITLDAILQEGPSEFSDGDTFNAYSLIEFTLMSSSNDGAFAIAQAANTAITGKEGHTVASFVEQMNKRAEEIGLTQTYFTNPTGLDTTSDRSGSYGSARDMAFLMEYIITKRPEILESTKLAHASYTNSRGKTFGATNTNNAASELEGFLGGKTGYTALAGGNLVVAFDISLNRPIIVSVLGSTQNGRFNDILKLSEAARKTIFQP